MPVSTTTPDDIRDDFVEAIKGITPNHTKLAEDLFLRAESPEEIRGPTIRTFDINCRPGVRLPGGFIGDGIQRTFKLEVWVSYGALGKHDDDSIIEEDGAQIEELLRTRIEPALPGLMGAEFLGWVPASDSEEESLFGFFEFDIIYYAQR